MAGPFEQIANRYLLGRKLVDLDAWPPNEPAEPNIVIQRLNWSIQWHTWSYLHARRWYTWLKGIQIVASAAIPVLSISGGDSFAVRIWVASLGALVVTLEGIQQLKKYAQNAILWGQGKEALKREYYLFKGGAPPYDKDETTNRLKLCQRTEQLVGQEVGRWAETQTEPQHPGPQPQRESSNAEAARAPVP